MTIRPPTASRGGRRWPAPALFLPILAAALVSQMGCGGGRDTAQISGRVQYADGSPITGAIRIIRFEPTGDSPAPVRKAASGEIAPDGTFELYTRVPGDGVYIGKYAVTFTVISSHSGGEVLIKPQYMSFAETPYFVEVTRDVNDLVFEIERK